MEKCRWEDRFPCGNVEAELRNGVAFCRYMRVIFLGGGIYFFWLVLHEPFWGAKAENMALVIFCLWRIYRQQDILCVIAAEGLIVRRQFATLREFWEEQVRPEKRFIFLPYEHIFYISPHWREIQMGEPVEGGIVIVPVHLQFLHKADKRRIVERIRSSGENEFKNNI
ncbi:hypothetical protein [uncultured Megasphaera sp.]|uniref:hypothetical protein n=1 Tax=uncultured Megasphaera sp. TaxID=165188 RepID=UPI0028897377|nr:hypothetical protein [uncultured Megasphaera sp.]